MSDLCSTILAFEACLPDFLAKSANLQRKFREESVSDFLMFELLKLNSPQVMVNFSDEPKTGADMEWLFVQQFGSGSKAYGRYLRILLQAKKAKIKTPNFNCDQYSSLIHPASSKAPGIQCQTLLRTASSHPGTVSTYLFYHSRFVCNNASAARLTIHPAAVSIAEHVFLQLLLKSTSRAAMQKVRNFIGFQFPLHRLFCGTLHSSSYQGFYVPTPESVARMLFSYSTHADSLEDRVGRAVTSFEGSPPEHIPRLSSRQVRFLRHGE